MEAITNAVPAQGIANFRLAPAVMSPPLAAPLVVQRELIEQQIVSHRHFFAGYLSIFARHLDECTRKIEKVQT